MTLAGVAIRPLSLILDTLQRYINGVENGRHEHPHLQTLIHMHARGQQTLDKITEKAVKLDCVAAIVCLVDLTLYLCRLIFTH